MLLSNEGENVQKALKLAGTPNIMFILRNKLVLEILDCAAEVLL